MRPLSFENLRRLVGRKKDRNEPSFKRSESFKRISIRKSYLDRGKRRQNRLQKNSESTTGNNPTHTANDHDKIIVGSAQIKEQEPKKSEQERSLSSRDSITYDEWLQGVSSSSREKLHEESSLESLQQSKLTTVVSAKRIDADSVADDLKILELDASPVLSSKSSHPFRIAAADTAVRNETTHHDHDGPLWTSQESVEAPPSVRISLGRVWRETTVPTQPASTPASYPSVANSPVHRSLDSALKEKKPQPTVARTVSAPEKPVSKDTSSASSSSFGFSLRIAKLADFRQG